MTSRGFSRTTAVLALGVLGVVLLIGCGGEPEPDADKDVGKQPPRLNVLIGVVLPLSGERKSDGESVLAGLQLALKEKGDVVGLDASSLKVEDAAARPQDVVSIVANLVEADEVSMLIGPLDADDVKACESIVAKRKVPLLTTSSAEIDLIAVGSTVWRLACTDVQEGRAMAEFAAKKGYRTVAVIDDSDMPASVSRGRAFFERFEELSGTGTVSRVSYDRGVLDFRRTVSMVAHDTRTRPAAFYLTGRRLESVAVLRKMKEMNVTGGRLCQSLNSGNHSTTPTQRKPGMLHKIGNPFTF